MNIRNKTVKQLQKRLRYLEATKRANSPEVCHIKGHLRHHWEMFRSMRFKGVTFGRLCSGTHLQ